jgi:hypothetical protein
MKSPQLGQRVWTELLDGTFVVIALHPKEALADLRSTDGTNAVQVHVPFVTIRAVGGDHSPTSTD